MAKEIVVAERDKRAYENFHFPSAVKHGDLILCSGRVGVGKGGVPDSAEEEFRNAWTIVGAVLEEAGADFGDIVEFTSYHVGMQEHLRTFMAVKDEFVKEPYPAWTAIGVYKPRRGRARSRWGVAIPGARAELRVIAQTRG